MSDDRWPEVEIYTDGACSPNPGPGGWAAIMRYGDHVKEITGFEPDTTNNRMELTAALEALRALKRPCIVHVYTDSQYLQRGVTEWLDSWRRRGWRGYRGKPVANVDLWKALVDELSRHEVHWHWVRGHADDRSNRRADRLAREAMCSGMTGGG